MISSEPRVTASAPPVRLQSPKGVGVPFVFTPQPESLLKLGLAWYQHGERDDVWNMEPIYLRPSAAEEKWESRSGT
jgi:tRNA A37 threonylcarbamoyladenosine modification protein TsaB